MCALLPTDALSTPEQDWIDEGIARRKRRLFRTAIEQEEARALYEAVIEGYTQQLGVRWARAGRRRSETWFRAPRGARRQSLGRF